MTEPGQPHPKDSEPADSGQPMPEGEGRGESFFAAAIPRMMRSVLLLGAILTVIAGWRFGRAAALGFAAGAIMAYFSFRSLYRAVEGLASRIVDAKRPERGFSLVHGFFLRYLLAGGVAYVIFTGSSQAFRGFLFGLCTPVGAMLVEAGFEAYVALRRGY